MAPIIVERTRMAALVMAAANQRLHAADASISPGTVALELRAAIAMLQFNGTTPPQRSGRPVLRVIEVGFPKLKLAAATCPFWLWVFGFFR
jgi:hypothetical protein